MYVVVVDLVQGHSMLLSVATATKIRHWFGGNVSATPPLKELENLWIFAYHHSLESSTFLSHTSQLKP